MTEPPVGQRGRPVRRLRRIVAGVAIVLVVVLAVVAFVAIRGSVGPVVQASGSSGPRPGPGTKYVVVDTLLPDTHEVYAVDANRRGTFGIAFEILNEGRFAVTLQDAPRETDLVVQTTTKVSSVPLPGNDFRAGEDIALDGVVLEPGERRRLLATYSWIGLCLPDEIDSEDYMASTSIDSVKLRYAAFGGMLTREADLVLPTAVTLICGALPRPDGNYVTQGVSSTP